MRLISLGRLGLDELVSDHLKTWVEEDRPGVWRRSPSDYIVFLGLPALCGSVVVLRGIRIWSPDALLAGASIITGLLFGLLIHVLSLGLQLEGNDRVAPGSRLAILVGELRANVAWSCGVGLVLSGLLAGAGSFVKDLDNVGINPVYTGIVCALTVHLGLTLMMILKRVRSSYKMLSK